ncbi:hypothetical protein FSP39_012915 [Pinctada imbricata]|uniref:GPI ethanolamine phosphate transferase 3, catalytic subunit n=1 Tax=Pinctada imbricata TaxID=66713 RepID=A0AA88Y4K2_PINIB|nr:hypothetical protein FSP39_012915 [Pinctada imbricata]
MFIFAKGFLLKRVVVDRNSTCSVEFSHRSDLHGGKGCWMHGSFKKAIIIVIDALRYDFIKYDENFVNESLPYKNKLLFVNQLLLTKPFNSKLYRFLADPPTTTLQRLKGLTTGSLPTFVDASANFASSEITEDNFVDQMIKQGKTLKFLGDDTWMGLYPGRFYRSFPFPSFNVKDLHTVDNGILENLIPELRKKDWDITIAHFLGVDHCGHRYGPMHPAMAEKLSQMNEMIRNVTRVMDGDTVLFVFGDHGMTGSGDHGGDSKDELEAGLFVYSPSQITSFPTKDVIQDVQQTDLVPSISLLLGVPIPFSNLGHAITDLFTFCPSWKSGSTVIKQVFHSVKALRLNAHQISLYIQEYYKHSSDFPINKYYELGHILSSAENELQAALTAMVKDGETRKLEEKLVNLRSKYTKYITEVRKICQSIWAKFDLTSITIGIMTIFIALLINIYCIRVSYWWKVDVPSTSIVVILITIVYTAFAAFQSFFIGESLTAFMVYLLGGFLIIGLCVLIIKFQVKNPLIIQKENNIFTVSNFETSVSLLGCILYFLSYFSNSFVVNEDVVILFLAQTLVWMYCISIVLDSLKLTEPAGLEPKNKRHKGTKTFDIMRFFTHPTMLVFIVTLFTSVSLRLSTVFAACREEKWNCDLSVFLLPLGNLVNQLQSYKNMRYFFSVACLVLLTFITRQWMKHYGNLNGASISVLCARYFCPIAVVCCSLHWALQGLPPKILDNMPVWQQVFLPRIVYILVLVTLFCIAFNPLCVFIKPSAELSSLQALDRDKSAVPYLFTKLKEKLEEKAKEKPQVAYGLATSYTAAIVCTVTAMSILLSMLLGDGPSPSLLLALFSAGGFLEIITLREKHSKPPSFLCYVVTFSMMTSLYFYNTGHQATVPSIRFEAAFNGFHGDFDNKIIPGLLIHLNTFVAEVFFGILSPLIIFWPLTEGIFVQWILKKSKEQEQRWKGDFILYEDGDTLRKLLFRLLSCIFIFHGIKIFGATCAACLHRRHLMVWKIFAPRFVFQAMSCFTMFGISMLMYLLIMRVDKSLDVWVSKVSQTS